MKRIFVLSFILICFPLFIISGVIPNRNPIKPKFKVFFVQDNFRSEIEFDNQVIVMENKPFVIEVHLINCDGVYANISFDTAFYSTPRKKELPDWKNLPPRTMAEEDFNVDKDIIVHPGNISYWFYNPNLKWYRFDKEIKVNGDETIATMTVENIYDLENGIHYSVGDKFPMIYFTFFTGDTDKKGYMNHEFERKRVILQFKNYPKK